MSREKLRILLAEGDSGRLTAALRQLYPEGQNHLELTEVSGVSTLMATLEVVNPELIFLDLSLGQPDPLDAVRLVHRAAPEVPLIVVADEANKDLAARSLNQGALDYLVESRLDPATIERVLQKVLEQNTVEGLANLLRDPVTGLHTRDGFLTLAGRALDNAARRESTLVLLCMLVENLDAIRAEFGLSAAESTLREIGKLLAGSFRRTDIVARLGDSQFAALAVDAVEPSAPVLCQRLEKRITVLNKDIGPWGPLEPRMSVGFWRAGDTTWFPEFLDSVEAGLRVARQETGREAPLENQHA
ncbi:MAG TPA: diguanylate cyclase [Candidatus Angelobacter sp.]|nr:diguanylate cyclase [Candidatus Angelobacter sp.]